MIFENGSKNKTAAIYSVHNSSVLQSPSQGYLCEKMLIVNVPASSRETFLLIIGAVASKFHTIFPHQRQNRKHVNSSSDFY